MSPIRRVEAGTERAHGFRSERTNAGNTSAGLLAQARPAGRRRPPAGAPSRHRQADAPSSCIPDFLEGNGLFFSHRFSIAGIQRHRYKMTGSAPKFGMPGPSIRNPPALDADGNPDGLPLDESGRDTGRVMHVQNGNMPCGTVTDDELKAAHIPRRPAGTGRRGRKHTA